MPRLKRRDSVSHQSTPEAEHLPRSSRRSKVPKRFLDGEFKLSTATPITKKRNTRNSSNSTRASSLAKEDAKEKTPCSSRQKGPRGRPAKRDKKPRKEKKPWEEDVAEEFEAEYESETSDSSDDDYIEPEDDEDEDIDFDNIKIEPIEETSHAFCPWAELDPSTIPKLELPESSRDIVIPQNAIFDVIEIYEILRGYHRTLRLTPFTFESFCAALISSENSCIMAEVHICLLRICLKSDDEEQVHFSVTDSNIAVNIILHNLETMTYAEVIRQYIESYPGVDDSVRAAINAYNYPYVGFEPKIIVLLFLCYRFLYSVEYRKVVNNGGKPQHDETCRLCGKGGSPIVGCVRCDAAFHPSCSGLEPFPETLICNLCTQNVVRGVTDSLPFEDTIEKEPLRMRPIGRDRHGRIYWWVIRRIIVQSEDDSELYYYSTPPQLYQLVQSLDANYYEKDLCDFIRKRTNEILEQMTLTLEMSTEKRDELVKDYSQRMKCSMAEANEAIPTVYFHRDNLKRMSHILKYCADKVASKDMKVEEMAEGDIVKKEEEECEVFSATMLGITAGRLVNVFWSGGYTEEELFRYYYEHGQEKVDPFENFRLGDQNDGSFRNYKNYYANNEMAESAHARKKISDRKKYISSKFSFMDDTDYAFSWSIAKGRNLYGNELLHSKYVEWTINKLINKIPSALFHRRWIYANKSFFDELKRANHFKKLCEVLLKLEVLLRKPIFVPQWWNGLGQFRFERTTQEQRDLQSKEFQKQKKLEADCISKDLDDSFIKVNYTKTNGVNTYLLRQKGEYYRNAGKHVMGGWMWISAKFASTYVGLPKKPGVEEAPTNEETTANRKAKRLECVVEKMRRMSLKKKSAQESSTENEKKEHVLKCYSSTCREERLVCSDLNNSLYQSCYSADCRAAKQAKQNMSKPRGIVGEDLPWPIPQVHRFESKGNRNIFVVEPKILRKLICTAGREHVYIPGFSSNSKTNFAVWNYPAPRPCFDLSWRWNTLNARSLHAVALQLKILWLSIRWQDMEPEDNDHDRRVVIGLATHDERRRIIGHKEMGPFGQYERYKLEVEIIPLHNEDEDVDDEAWSSKKEREGIVVRGRECKKRKSAGRQLRMPKAVRHEWIDGVELRLFEIKDYWEKVIPQLAPVEKKPINPQGVVRYQSTNLLPMQMPRSMPRMITPTIRTPQNGNSSRTQTLPNTVSIENRKRRLEPSYLSAYNTSQIPPRPVFSNINVEPNPKRSRIDTPVFISRAQPTGTVHVERAAAGAEKRIDDLFYGQVPRITQPYRRTSGYDYSDIMVRGGVRMPMPAVRRAQPRFIKPVGEPNSEMRRVVVPVSEEGASAVASDGDEQPPIIPRYGSNGPNTDQGRAPARQIVYNSTNQARGKPVYVIKRPDGTPGSAVMVRSNVNGEPTRMELPPGSVVVQQPSGQRIVQVRTVGNVPRQLIAQGQGNSRIFRVPAAGQSQQQLVRRVMIQSTRPQPVMEEPIDGMTAKKQYVVSGPNFQKGRQPQRGGTTMQIAQQQAEGKRAFSTKRKVTTYRDFMASRGYLDSSRLPARPLLLPFEFNEEEEREISEAIAREEELMRIEEENKAIGMNYDSIGNQGHSSRVFFSSDHMRHPPYVSNLLPSINDTPDDKIIKQVLDVMFSQVCRWDKQYGWSKMHLKRARQKNDTEKFQMRKMRMNQREMLLSEHVERLKKEINKRRTKLENEAEQQCGLLTPWRKSRTRPQRSTFISFFVEYETPLQVGKRQNVASKCG
ncbi:unnamed protein product [Caenorhabditis bovis]|uniref:DDT domain-containing protein n=1 Tax=Caenorhabditis bovis TaxID=2654633 RepID=A0A8S1F1X1_9PELO|nr:unnamed protein product [Caenorhabditis bovis]